MFGQAGVHTFLITTCITDINIHVVSLNCYFYNSWVFLLADARCTIVVLGLDWESKDICLTITTILTVLPESHSV